MLKDLKQYTSLQATHLESDTYGWYVKQFCQHCKNQSLVNEIIEGIETSINTGFSSEDYDILSDLIDDMHVQDALGSQDNLMLKIIVNCFVDECIVEANLRPYQMQFMEYSNTGRRINGLNPNVLSEWLEEWDEFANIYGEEDCLNPLTDAEIINALNDGTIDELYELTAMESCLIVVDEKSDGIYDLEEVLDIIGFNKVCDGLYYHGIIYDIEWQHDVFTTKEEILDIYEIINQNEPTNTLENYPFNALNETVSNYSIIKLSKMLQFSESTREVMF